MFVHVPKHNDSICRRRSASDEYAKQMLKHINNRYGSKRIQRFRFARNYRTKIKKLVDKKGKSAKCKEENLNDQIYGFRL